jgi:flagellar hook-length control protein FliK
LKGGEKVQVGGLGMINTMIAGEKSSPVARGSGFAGLFGSLLSTPNVSSKVDSLNPLLNGSSSQDLKGLLGFLNNDDVLDLKDGVKLLDHTLNADGSDLLSSIKAFLGLNDQDVADILKKLQSLLANSAVDKGKKAEKTDENQAASHVEVTTGSKELDELLACLNQIISLPIQDVSKLTNKDFSEVVKTVKLYELLTKNQDGQANNTKVTDLIQQTIQKLEILVDQNKGASRTEYVQKTFSSLAAELQSIKNAEKVQDKNPVPFKLDSTNGLAHLHQMSKPEQMVIMLENGGKPVSTEQLIKQFENILSKSQFSNTGGTQRLLIKLNPENLGSLRIELIQKDSTIVARIMTSTGAAKDALESQLQGLKHAFSAQNILVDRIEVTQQQGMAQQERFFQKDQHQGHQGEGQSRRDQTDDGEFNQSFEEALLNTEV